MIIKDKKMSVRISSTDLENIKIKAKKAKLTLTEYVTKCCLDKEIIIINGLNEVIKQQKAVGKNLNQLTLLANMNRVNVINLAEATEQFSKINESLHEILERKRWQS